MLTTRGFSFAIVSHLLLAWGMLSWVIPWIGRLLSRTPAAESRDIPLLSVELLGLTLVGWFWWEWLRFAFRARVRLRQMTIERELFDERGTIASLWTRRRCHVRVTLRWPGEPLPCFRVTDLLPSGVEFLDGATQYEGGLDAGQAVSLNYELRCIAIGPMYFAGVRIWLADPQGFFYWTSCVRDGTVYRVLPPLTDDAGHAATVKRFNLLPPPGQHRLRSPGSGSELLDLRDYLNGDPPKTIAWKVSARRGRLITKEFESEVPLRCTLFVDTSQGVRRGEPGHDTLNRLVELAACIAQANASARDLTGLCLFDEERHSYLRPARGPRQLAVLIQRLTDAAAQPAVSSAPLSELLPRAFALAQTVYPELLHPKVNRFPAWLAWLFPPWAELMSRPTLGDRLYAMLPAWVLLLNAAAMFLQGALLKLCLYLFEGSTKLQGLTWMLAALILMAELALGMLLFKLRFYLFPGQRLRYRRRKLLAALLSTRYGLAPGGLAVLLEDEKHFCTYAQRFLHEHRVPLPDAAVPPEASAKKIPVLAEALLRAVRTGHDNELFVLMVDLRDLKQQLDPLLQAVRVAVARHHQVVVVCPGVAGSLGQQAFQQLRREFARMRVIVIRADQGEPVRLVLDRLERMRMLGGKR